MANSKASNKSSPMQPSNKPVGSRSSNESEDGLESEAKIRVIEEPEVTRGGPRLNCRA
jgi:hypothetical protein